MYNITSQKDTMFSGLEPKYDASYYETQMDLNRQA